MLKLLSLSHLINNLLSIGTTQSLVPNTDPHDGSGATLRLDPTLRHFLDCQAEAIGTTGPPSSP